MVSGGHFVDSVPEIQTAQRVDEDDVFVIYSGRLEAQEGTVRILTVRDEVVDSAVEATFQETTGQWYNSSTHPNVVSVHSRGTEPKPWVGTAPRRGTQLKTVQPDLSLGAVAEILSDAASAIRNAGLYNTRHSHLEPEHVWVSTRDGGVTSRVADWGLDWNCRAAIGATHCTPFTPPELVEDSNASSELTDVYGLAAVAYFALTGTPPVSDEGPLEAAVLDQDPTPPTAVDDSLPDAVDDVLATALARDPSRRHESAFAFKQAFTAAIPGDAEVRVQNLDAYGEDSSGTGNTTQSETRSEDDTRQTTRTQGRAHGGGPPSAGTASPNGPRERPETTSAGAGTQAGGDTNTFYCNTCGRELSPTASYCPQCGAESPLERADHPAGHKPSTSREHDHGETGATVYCPACGREHDPAASFCRSCGRQLKGTDR